MTSNRILVLATLLLVSAVPAGAGYFEVLWAAGDSYALGSDQTRVIGKSQAKYVGAVDANDKSWLIQADINDDINGSLGGWSRPDHFGAGNNGVGIQTGLIIHCDGACGADAALPNCLASEPVRFRVRGITSIYHQFSPEISAPRYYDGQSFCRPEEPEEDPLPYDPIDPSPPESPVIVMLESGPPRFTGIDDPVLFDIDANGTPELITWTDADYTGGGFLVLDRDGNGSIDDGGELFGTATAQPESSERNGFLALAIFDVPAQGGNGDGLISRADAVFASLDLWFDGNHDGLAQPGELLGLVDTEVGAIELDYVVSERRDRHGNRLRWASHVHFDHGRRLAAVDVIFQRSE